jgi:hypothetical protein
MRIVDAVRAFHAGATAPTTPSNFPDISGNWTGTFQSSNLPAPTRRTGAPAARPGPDSVTRHVFSSQLACVKTWTRFT